MSFRSRRMVNRTISRRLQKYKHVVDATFLNVNANLAVQTATVALGSDNPAIAASTSVQARARVKAIYVEITFLNTGNAIGADQQFDWYFIFNPQAGFATPAGNNVGIQNIKNYVFKQGLGHTQSSANTTPYSVRGLIKIPTKFQRYMNADILQFVWSTRKNNGNTDQCSLKVIYKEVRG